MAPPTSSTPSSRPSSRRALTRALELAQEAVRIDATGEDPHAAVHAYALSVNLLSEVMERVLRGDDESSKKRSSGRKSVHAREDEARRLRSIHDTYFDRMQILVMIYGIPQPEILKSPPPSTSYTSFAAAAESSGQAGHRTSELAHASTESLSEDQHDPYASEDQHTDDYFDDGGALDPYGATAGGHHYQSDDAVANDGYLPDVTPRAPPASQLPPTRSTNQIPPMRQPPAGPPPVRPRVDSLPRRTSRPGPPGQPPSMAPPPLPTAPLPPLPQQSGQYDLASPPVDDRQRYGFPRDARPSGSVEHHVSVPEDAGEILDDWDDDSEDPAEVEEIRRSYLPPSQTQQQSRPRTKRQGTSDSEGSMLTGARRHDLHYSQQQQPPIGMAQNDSGYADHQHYSGSQFHPFAQPDIPTHVEEDRPHPFSSRPPTPGNRPRGNTQSSATSSRSGESSAFSDRPRTPPPMPQLVSNSTAQGTISQRRKVNGPVTAGGLSASLDVYEPHHAPTSRSHSPAAMEASSSTSAPQSRLTSLQPSGGSAVSLSATSSANTTVGRHRAASQPGRRPSLVGMHAPPSSFPGVDVEPVPPLPQTALPRKTSFTSSSQSIRTASSATAFSGHPSLPPLSIAAAQAPATPSGFYASAAGANLAPSSSQPGIPKSPIPPPPPAEILRRPYHLMYLLYISITAGGYISRKLHVPRDVWTQGGAKLTSLPEKGKCVAIIDQGLDELSKASKDFLRAAQVNAAGLSGTGISRAVGERWLRALDEWVQVCDGVVGNLGKKLGVGDGGASKKAAGWGNKVSRTFDRMTNGKSLDSPTSYVQGLAGLFQDVQFLGKGVFRSRIDRGSSLFVFVNIDDHHRLLASSMGSYASMPIDIRSQIEARLKRTSEFFCTVVIAFVVQDLGLLLDKYAKKGEKWLNE
ncbi:hypothetical protein FS837_002993 [Tulasnella sp. UAMH 9824]|nr:hypothetical protein FS837_002993 [Tulasnella sp. UAMH 9824]